MSISSNPRLPKIGQNYPFESFRCSHCYAYNEWVIVDKDNSEYILECRNLIIDEFGTAYYCNHSEVRVPEFHTPMKEDEE